MTSTYERLRAGPRVCGLSITSGSAAAAELAAQLGFSTLLIDARHAAVSPFSGELEAIIRAASVAGAPALVSVPELTAGAINRALNDGADGVIVPDVRTVEDAQHAVDAARYPPIGRRGAAPCVRAAGYGVQPWDEYYAETNTERMLLLSIETLTADALIAELAAVEGVSGVIFDAASLALSAAVAVEELVVRLGRARAQLTALGAVSGVHLPSGADPTVWARAGYDLIIIDGDLAACGKLMGDLLASLTVVPRTVPQEAA